MTEFSAAELDSTRWDGEPTHAPVVFTYAPCMIAPMAAVTVNRTLADLTRAVQEAIATIDALEKGLGVKAPNLSPASKRRTARYRKGGDKVISTIGSVALQQRLDLPRMPVSEMADQLQIASTISSLLLRVTILGATLGNIVFSARADAWQTAMQYYALLQRVARRNTQVAAALEPVTRFMSVHDPRRKRQVGDPTRPQERAVKKAQRTLARLPPAAIEAANKKKRRTG
jgi:hypothetical protein